MREDQRWDDTRNSDRFVGELTESASRRQEADTGAKRTHEENDSEYVIKKR